MTMQKVLLAEDDFDFGSILKQYLELHGFVVEWAKDGEEAIAMFHKIEPAICVLDVMMPKKDGFALAEEIIAITPEMPFIFLTARGQKEDKIKGLKLGADDYIVKPFEADELVLRIQNIIKRSQRVVQEQKSEETLQIGIYKFNTKSFLLEHSEFSKRVTEKEATLIAFFYAHKNTLIKREQVLTAVWGNDDFFSGRSMDVFISRLRKYFALDPNISLESIRGIGLEFKIK